MSKPGTWTWIVESPRQGLAILPVESGLQPLIPFMVLRLNCHSTGLGPIVGLTNGVGNGDSVGAGVDEGTDVALGNGVGLTLEGTGRAGGVTTGTHTQISSSEHTFISPGLQPWPPILMQAQVMPIKAPRRPAASISLTLKNRPWLSSIIFQV
jgi:hypothetical protein